jgi:hypothetical protein
MKTAGTILLCLVILGEFASVSGASQTDLGAANQFAVLSSQSTVTFGANDKVATVSVTPAPSCPGTVGCAGDAGGVTISIGLSDSLAADAIASQGRGSGSRPATAITIGSHSTIAGQCVTGGGSITGGSACAGGSDTSGTNSKVTTLLPSAVSAAIAFAEDLSGLTATQTLPAVSLNSGQAYGFTTQAGVNVIALPSLIANGNNKITITAGATDAVIINVGNTSAPGKFQLGAGTQFLLSGGITPDRVLFNVAGKGAAVSIDCGSTINGTILAASDAIIAGDGAPGAGKGTTINGALIAGESIALGCNVTISFYPFPNVFQTQGSCLTSSSLSLMVQGNNVSAYIPKANWTSSATGVSVIQIEGSGISPTAIATANPVNSCASNPLTGQTVCVSNGTDVYLLEGTSLTTTLTDSAINFAAFSGGLCETCGVTIDLQSNQAILTEGTPTGGGGFQILDLASQTFETPFASPGGSVSEEILYDPNRQLLVSPSENGDYELINLSASPNTFFENTVGGQLDSAAEECSTGIALASDEFSDQLYIADLTQATFTSGSPSGTWTAPGGFETFPEFSNLTTGTTGISVAQGSHLGIVTGEFGGNWIGAIRLPATSGSGTPAIQDYVACPLPAEPNGDIFAQGFDPHTVTAYVSPNSGDAIGLSADQGPFYVAVIDLTKLLNTAIVPRVSGTHRCSTSVDLLSAGVVSYVAVP